MKKICILVLFLSFVTMLTCGCEMKKQKANMIQSKRRFEQYVQPKTESGKNVVDLSEGPKQNYDAYLGPKSLNFDIKIVDPY